MSEVVDLSVLRDLYSRAQALPSREDMKDIFEALTDMTNGLEATFIRARHVDENLEDALTILESLPRVRTMSIPKLSFLGGVAGIAGGATVVGLLGWGMKLVDDERRSKRSRNQVFDQRLEEALQQQEAFQQKLQSQDEEIAELKQRLRTYEEDHGNGGS